MELVEGEDLSVVIARGAMPLAEALPIARQIADALEAAHEQGIIHRDLKPANIKVRADGTVKVLDFGLAKALAPEGASATADAMNSPTPRPPRTATARHAMGMIIGTAAYMAPEQARGKAVDKRADIWAFGVVLYEMLTGRRAFPGDDVSDTLARVLKSEPDVGRRCRRPRRRGASAAAPLPREGPAQAVEFDRRRAARTRRDRVGWRGTGCRPERPRSPGSPPRARRLDRHGAVAARGGCGGAVAARSTDSPASGGARHTAAPGRSLD